jgi:hypothetical protein
MSRQVLELEQLLQGLITEHRKLLVQLDLQQAAMKTFDLKAMDDAANLQEATRLRIAALENRRRSHVAAMSKLLRVPDLNMTKIVELHPQRRAELTKLRTELKAIIGEISTRTTVAGRLAGAVLGHLNTVVRLMATAVEHAGTYTKNGIPRVSPRIGVMEAVG